MKTMYIIIAILLALFLIGIFGIPYLYKDTSEDQLVGGDKDENGCIATAGYTWNITKQECVREWEEALKDACTQLGCPQNSLFAGSINSDKYYECDCRYAKNINPENIICFANDDEALADGRVKSEC